MTERKLQRDFIQKESCETFFYFIYKLNALCKSNICNIPT